MIKLNQLTKTFEKNKGIFSISFQVEPGEVFGFIGPNGAGKSTTIRHLLGFLKADSGSAFINGLDCWKKAPELKRLIGYVPGEPVFIDGLSGHEFLEAIRTMRGQAKDNRTELLERFELKPDVPLHKMSKGMKQKIALTAAFMHDPQVLILDEPTSGLDPLMQQRFIELILEGKRKGKTILMSSHSFPEMEKTCDRAAMIKNGRVILNDDMNVLQAHKQQQFHITLADASAADSLVREFQEAVRIDPVRVSVSLQGDPNSLVRALANYEIKGFTMEEETLEKIFMNHYGKEAV